MRRIFLFIIIFPTCSLAFSVDKHLENHEQEMRAEKLFKEIRCLVCAGQSIAESNADLAGDMRNLIRDKIRTGNGDDAIKNYIATRYGERILLQTPWKTSTFLLWATPFIFLGGGIYFIFGRRRKP